jgi:microcystin-dependent protein
VPDQGFIGDIIMFGGNFAPRGWAFCNGQIMQIADNDALFSLIGTTYGGDGQTTFALPDLRGRVPIHMGQAPGLSSYPIGQMGGAEQITLTTQQVPSHTHPFGATTATGAQQNPGNNLLANSQGPAPYIEQDPDNNLNPNMLSKFGGSQGHENRQPYQGINFVICLEGVYPSRS